ncbi:hypothetical protein DPMN_051225 [Dreissena polymorpha]|uniref:Uncharacterized protein n=1 Tax=Dreissena polymorpha TaxID=45954 RepID=A0A9D4CIZ9_DREPO|nr:hypothetical protein DPMN_051225 [Dreissena polymorpha]
MQRCPFMFNQEHIYDNKGNGKCVCCRGYPHNPCTGGRLHVSKCERISILADQCSDQHASVNCKLVHKGAGTHEESVTKCVP